MTNISVVKLRVKVKLSRQLLVNSWISQERTQERNGLVRWSGELQMNFKSQSELDIALVEVKLVLI